MAYGKLLRELGFAVSFVLEERYLAFEDSFAIEDTISGRGYCNNPGTQQFDLVVFYNSAVKNHSLASALRERGTTVLYVFHEPEPINSLSVLRSEGLKKTVRFVLSSLFSIRTTCTSSAVIVCSSYGRALYDRGYQRFNSNVHVLPLLFDDEIGQELFEQMRSHKRYLGFVGTACKSHGFDVFVEFAKYALRNGSDIPFVIATWVDLSSLLQSDQELAGFVEQGRIRMQHGRRLSNDEINQHYMECFCIWNVYRRSTQSGVLPRSFMAGTPVLASRVGSFPEEVQPGFTGEFVDVNEDPAAILATVQNLRAHTADYFDECRKRFLEKFYFRANRNQLTEILESTSISKSIAKTIPTGTHQRRA
jgi:glycosyltransferase involved in cell wall biosynthesis